MAAQAARRIRRDPQALEKDLAILRVFIRVYCARQHLSPRGTLCTECSELLSYAQARLAACPYEPKPRCKHCPTHCYKPLMRARIKAVMRYSGIYFVKRGRLDWLVKYFLSGS